MGKYKEAKTFVLKYFEELERATEDNVEEVIEKYVASSCNWKGVYPFCEKNDVKDIIDEFWLPLKKSLKNIQRRQDIFIAGENEMDGEIWVMSMGHFMGNFENDWLGIRHTNKIINLRYAEFNCVKSGEITQTGMFVDIIGMMQQAGVNPLPPQTGHYYIYPGPKNHDGLLFKDADSSESEKTLKLVNKMVSDLDVLNRQNIEGCPPEVLEQTWSDDMIWYGPAGIGASYTINKYQAQHQLPFRNNLEDKVFHGHTCRFSEGNFACFFGWPNLSNSPSGDFLGMPGGGKDIKMQVVDIYYREGDKLKENWVFIDIPYWLKQQGLDILERTKNIYNR